MFDYFSKTTLQTLYASDSPDKINTAAVEHTDLLLQVPTYCNKQ